MSGDDPNREQLVEALVSFSDDELKQQATRLARSVEAIEQALIDVQAEQEQLKQEKAQLVSTIDLMMGELKKLNITSANIAEPKLDESPLQYVGRMWEQVRPRDTAVHVSEHVGEIRKPSESTSSVQQLLDGYGLTPSAVPSSEELGRQILERGQELGKRGEDLRQELGKQVTESFTAIYDSIDKMTTGAEPPEAEDEDNTIVEDEGVPASASTATPLDRAQQNLQQVTTQAQQNLQQVTAHAQQNLAYAQQNLEQVTAHAQQNLEHVTSQGREWGRSLSNRLSAAFDDLEKSTGHRTAAQVRTQGRDWSRKMSDNLSGAFTFFAGATAEAKSNSEDDERPQSSDGPSVSALFSYLGTSTSSAPQLGPDSAGPDQASPSSAAKTGGKPSEINCEGSNTKTDADRSDSTQASGVQTFAMTPTAAETEGVRSGTSQASGGAEANGPDSPGSPGGGANTSLLIECKITLGDGSVQVIEVRAADRCKDVAARFVQEHSLKAGFEAPLQKYLMAAETNAERFPVHLEADLLDIQREYVSSNH